MQPVVAGLLWTGNARDARDHRRIADAGIEAVVDVSSEEEPAVLPRSMTYCRIPLRDGQGNEACNLRLAIQVVASLVSSNVPTLVACSAGMSRSPCVAVGGLAIARGTWPDDELKALAESRSLSVSPALWHEVTEMCRSLSDPT